MTDTTKPTDTERIECDFMAVTDGEIRERDELFQAVNAFARAMKVKLANKTLDGKSGWQETWWIESGNALEQLLAHAKKGDMVDVANFAMFIWYATR